MQLCFIIFCILHHSVSILVLTMMFFECSSTILLVYSHLMLSSLSNLILNFICGNCLFLLLVLLQVLLFFHLEGNCSFAE
jgi:hypothetical protein